MMKIAKNKRRISRLKTVKATKLEIEEETAPRNSSAPRRNPKHVLLHL